MGKTRVKRRGTSPHPYMLCHKTFFSFIGRNSEGTHICPATLHHFVIYCVDEAETNVLWKRRETFDTKLPLPLCFQVSGYWGFSICVPWRAVCMCCLWCITSHEKPSSCNLDIVQRTPKQHLPTCGVKSFGDNIIVTAATLPQILSPGQDIVCAHSALILVAANFH